MVGWIIGAFFAHGPIAISVLFLVVFLQIWLFRSRWGLRTRAVGEHPKAAETVGIDVIKLRYRNVILGGVFAGLAGAYLTLEQSGSFQNGMTSGRGFIALAAVIFGRWTPLGAFGAALLFTASEALRVAISLQPPTGQLGDVIRFIPAEFYGALPYFVTLVVLVAAGRPERRASGRREAVHAGSADLRPGRMTEADRSRAAAFLDLQEGRGPVPVLDDAGIERTLRATRRIAVVGASSDRGRPSFTVFRYLVQQGFECVPVNPNVHDVLGVPAFRDPGRGGRGDGPVRPGRRLPTLRVLRHARS